MRKERKLKAQTHPNSAKKTNSMGLYGKSSGKLVANNGLIVCSLFDQTASNRNMMPPQSAAKYRFQ